MKYMRAAQLAYAWDRIARPKTMYSAVFTQESIHHTYAWLIARPSKSVRDAYVLVERSEGIICVDDRTRSYTRHSASKTQEEGRLYSRDEAIDAIRDYEKKMVAHKFVKGIAATQPFARLRPTPFTLPNLRSLYT